MGAGNHALSSLLADGERACCLRKEESPTLGPPRCVQHYCAWANTWLVLVLVCGAHLAQPHKLAPAPAL